jgi:DNA-3-methyladenine glycosylase I
MRIDRCSWAQKEIFHDYHDHEWGKPVYDDNLLFEMLILEGAQAGLSWETILKRRTTYRAAYHAFDPLTVSKFTTKERLRLLSDVGIIRNRLKVEASIINAKAFIQIQKEFGSFSQYLWSFTDNQIVDNKTQSGADVPVSSELSDIISKDLKKRGFKFVGTTIIYAYLQAVGVVNDHELECFARTN